MRVCLVYDCLHPWTFGGEERWLRTLAETLAADGHDVTYLTRLQWDRADPPRIPGVRVLAVSPAEPLYGADGSRRVAPPIRFARGVAAHLVRHRSSYDVVHTCAFPFFHLPLLRAALAGTRVPVVVDWPEVWSVDYWRSYVGGVGGLLGAAVQAACVRLTPTALTYSRTHGDRLDGLGLRRPALRPGGLGPDPDAAVRPRLEPPAVPTVVFAGRHIREKRPELVVRAVAAARTLIPGLRGIVYGDGPERRAVLRAVAELDASSYVAAPGFVPAAVLARGIRGATCLLLPSSREGFGIVVLEAAAVGTPVVVVAGPDNAAVELVEPGVNGEVARSAEPEAVADAIVRVQAAGEALRASAAAWYAGAAPRLAATATAREVERIYADLIARR